MLDLGSIYPAESDGKTCGKWQQFGFGNLEYIRTGCVAKLGIITEKRGNTAEVVKFERRLHVLYVGRGKMCKKEKKKNEKLNPL